MEPALYLWVAFALDWGGGGWSLSGGPALVLSSYSESLDAERASVTLQPCVASVERLDGATKVVLESRIEASVLAAVKEAR